MESLATKVDCAETILARKTEINRAAKGEAAAKTQRHLGPGKSSKRDKGARTNYFGAREATIFSKWESPRSGSQ